MGCLVRSPLPCAEKARSFERLRLVGVGESAWFVFVVTLGCRQCMTPSFRQFSSLVFFVKPARRRPSLDCLFQSLRAPRVGLIDGLCKEGFAVFGSHNWRLCEFRATHKK